MTFLCCTVASVHAGVQSNDAIVALHSTQERGCRACRVGCLLVHVVSLKARSEDINILPKQYIRIYIIYLYKYMQSHLSKFWRCSVKMLSNV